MVAVICCNSFLRLGQQVITNFRRPRVIAFALFCLIFDAQLFNPFLQRPRLRNQFFLMFPFSFQRVGSLADLRQFPVNQLQPLPRVGVIFFLQRLPLDFELRRPPL